MEVRDGLQAEARGWTVTEQMKWLIFLHPIIDERLVPHPALESEIARDRD